MNVNNDRLTKEELQYLIEKLSLADDQPAENEENNLEPSVLRPLQTDLKKRLQHSVDEMRARNEEVPTILLDLIERL